VTFSNEDYTWPVRGKQGRVYGVRLAAESASRQSSSVRTVASTTKVNRITATFGDLGVDGRIRVR
jgi:hypothetical protein